MEYRYSFCDNNPVSKKDPNGRSAIAVLTAFAIKNAPRLIGAAVGAGSYIVSTLIQGEERKKVRIFCKDIICCYKDKETKVTVFVTSSGEVRERKNIQDVWNDLKHISNDFVFAERGCFVNMFYVSGISKNVLLLENGTSIKIGIRYVESLKKELENFWRKRIWAD